MPKKPEPTTVKKRANSRKTAAAMAPPRESLQPFISGWVEQQKSNSRADVIDNLLGARAMLSIDLIRRAHTELSLMFSEAVLAHINDEYSPGQLELLRMSRLTGDRDTWMDFNWISAADAPYDINVLEAKMIFGMTDIHKLKLSATRALHLLQIIDQCGGFRERIYRQMIAFGPGHAYEDAVSLVSTCNAEFA